MGKAEDFIVPFKAEIKLKNFDTDWSPKWVQEKKDEAAMGLFKEKAAVILIENKHKLASLQKIFWANDSYAILIILQGMDAAGKDGVIKHVMSGVNPQGCEVVGFRAPSEEDLDHDFLWRYSKALPERGRIGIFNRSYYEEVLIAKVRPEVLAKQKLPQEEFNKEFWRQRYKDINNFELHLVRNGTIILKFYLNISKEEQKRRLLKRLDTPEKHWKFSLSDISERSKWKNYMNAYEDLLNQTSTPWAPWHIIPSDKKWVARGLISQILVTQIERLDLKYPVLTKEQLENLSKAQDELMGE